VANVLLAYPNLTDAATLSGGSWQIPLTALQDRRVSRVARTTNTTSSNTKFVADMGKAKKLTVVALVGHNLTTQAKWRVRLSDAADFSTVTYDSGWTNAWQVVFTPDMLEWEDDNWWDGTIAETDRAGYPGLLLCQLDRLYLHRYVEVSFDDATNVDGFLQFGRLMLASAFQPAKNMSYGASLGYETDTKVTRSLAGAEYFDVKPGRRVKRFSLDWLTPDEARAHVLEMQRQLGVHGELLVMHNPDDKINMLRESFLARMRTISPLTQPYFAAFTNSFELQESIG
jgi:hypothetical protein